MKSILLSSCVILASALAFSGESMEIVRYPGTSSSLRERWEWVGGEASRRNAGEEYWIGYSIRRLMGKEEFVGTYYSIPRLNKPSLGEILQGKGQFHEAAPSMDMSESGNIQGSFTLCKGSEEHNVMVEKEVAILFHHASGTSIDEARISNFSLHVDLNDEPLFWLGDVDQGESIGQLQGIFRQTDNVDMQKEIVMAIGLHQIPEVQYPAFTSILTGNASSSVRAECAFWIGQLDTDSALAILIRSALGENSGEVRERAVFAISEMTGERSSDALIDLARNGNDEETRKKAMFWLGQKASKKAALTLGDIVSSDDDIEIQKSALFALTQLPDNEGTELIIRIARTHRSPEIRKQAIFWLSQSDDKRALDALVDIVRE